MRKVRNEASSETPSCIDGSRSLRDQAALVHPPTEMTPVGVEEYGEGTAKTAVIPTPSQEKWGRFSLLRMPGDNCLEKSAGPATFGKTRQIGHCVRVGHRSRHLDLP